MPVIPYLGAWAAGVFAGLIAPGGAGTAAIAMAVLALLANGLLQQMVQPIASSRAEAWAEALPGPGEHRVRLGR